MGTKQVLHFYLAGSPGEGVMSPNAATRLSATELYTKYAEAADRWREERLKNRQNEIVLESVSFASKPPQTAYFVQGDNTYKLPLWRLLTQEKGCRTIA